MFHSQVADCINIIRDKLRIVIMIICLGGVWFLWDPTVLGSRHAGLEARYVKEASKDRWHVLIAIFFFDLLTYTIRLGGRMMAAGLGALPAAVAAMIPQLLNMLALYTVLSWVNWRSRKSAGRPWAAFQVMKRHMRHATMHTLCLVMPDFNASDHAF